MVGEKTFMIIRVVQLGYHIVIMPVVHSLCQSIIFHKKSLSGLTNMDHIKLPNLMTLKVVAPRNTRRGPGYHN